MNIYDVAELQQYLNPQVNQQSTQLVDPTMLLRQRSPLLGIQSQRLVDPTTLIPQIPGGITASSAIPFGSPVDIAQGFVEGSPSDASFLLRPLRYDKDNNFYMMDSTIDNQTSDEKEEKTGIAKLFDFLSNFIPGVGLLKRLSDSGGIRSLNQRLRNTDFGRSRTLQEYFQKREARKEAERLAPIEKQLREASERGGGYQPTTRSQNVARTASRVSDGKTRAYGL